MSNKNKSKTNNFSNKTVGAVLITVSVILLLFSTFNILPFLKLFLLGSFGVVLYPILLLTIIVGLAFLTNQKFMFSLKYVLYLSFLLFSVISIIHIAVTASFNVSTYGIYLSETYYAMYTPGGIFVSIITYPFIALLNAVAGYVFFGVVITILSALIINYLHSVKQYSKLNAPIIISKEDKKGESMVDTSNLNFDFIFKPKEQVKPIIETKVFEDDETTKQAKKKLGLLKDEKENLEDIVIKTNKDPKSYTAAEQLFGEKEKNKQQWLNNTIANPSAAKPPKIVYDEKENKLKEFLRATTTNPNNLNPIINAEGYKDGSIDNFEPIKQTIQTPDLKNIESAKPSYVEEDVVIKESEFKTEQKIQPAIEPIKNSNISDIKNKIESSLNRNINVSGGKVEGGSNKYEQVQIIGTEKQRKTPTFTPIPNAKYEKPKLELLNKVEIDYQEFEEEQLKNSEIIERTLDEFKIPVKVQAVRRGAAVTRYELKMPMGIPVKKVHNHCEDIELALATKGGVRIETPIRGKSAVGIEVPNDKIDIVPLRDVIESKDFYANQSPLSFALGKDVDGRMFTCNLIKMSHVLVAGSTNSGKSVCLNSLIISLLYRLSPDELKLILVDPKRVEFTSYNDLPHLIMPKVITDSQKAVNAFDWLINEMERRYMVFQDNFVNNITNYNALPEVAKGSVPKMPFIVMVVDELADLFATGNKKEIENKIVRLVQKARAAGIHLVLATQRPSVDVITGTIKTNLPCRIAFAVTNFVDSKTILDQGGAEKLLGRGDMLYSPIDGEPIRVQGAYISGSEVNAVVSYIKEHNKTDYDENISNAINKENNDEYGGGSFVQQETDPLFQDCLRLVVETGQASISMLQRRFSLGFGRAARIIDQMQLAKFISPSEGGKPRNVYMTIEEFEEKFGGKGD